MPSSFKAVILEKINEPLVVDYVAPTELKIGQVLVKILISGLCGAQLQEIAGLKGNSSFVPHLLGHEGCGIVEDIGPGVTKVKKGDKVIMHWRKGSGIESPFPEYIYKHKKISSGKVTTLSNYSIVSENRITPVLQNTPNELCALLGCGLSTAFGTINNIAKIKFGETVLILGCGGVGLNLIIASNLAGCGFAYGLDKSLDKFSFVEDCGGRFISNINQIEDPIDCIIDTTGSMSLVSNCLPLLSTRGRCVIVSQPHNDRSIELRNPAKFFINEGQTLSSTQGGSINPDEDFSRYIRLYYNNKINLEKIISHTFKLDQINDAVKLLISKKAGRIMIDTNL
jgi:Zn-dependent alcohol dehydrogenase